MLSPYIYPKRDRHKKRCSLVCKRSESESRIKNQESRSREKRMLWKLKWGSRRVEEEGDDEEQEMKKKAYPTSEETTTKILTVWRKSLVMSCKGFTVIDSQGNLVYRVDNYCCHPHEITLMDASGNSVLTLRRRTTKLGLVDRWLVYEGEEGKEGKKNKRLSERPICWVRKNVKLNLLEQSHGNIVQAYVYRGGCESDKRHAFSIEGCYAHRKCLVLDDSRKVVAEIKRKETNIKHVSFGFDIFHLIVHPGFDPAFAMALVLLLDQMFP